MTTMIAELYDALIAGGTPEDKARKAAETVAAYENRFSGIELKLTGIQGDVNLIKWMMGFVLAFQVAIFAKLFLH